MISSAYLIALKNKDTDKLEEKSFKSVVEFRNFVKEQITGEDTDDTIEYEIRAVYELIPVNNGYSPVLLYTALNKVGSLWWDELYEYLT